MTQNNNWQIKKLKDVAVIFDGQHTTPTYVECGIPFYSAENIDTNVLPKYISLEEYNKQTKKNIPQKGDILFTRIGSLGKNIIADWDNPFSIYVTLAIIRTKKEIDNKYLHQFLKSYTYQKDLFSKALLTAYPQKINMEDLAKTTILYPPIKEQKKIVEVLESWDKAINLTKRLIEQKELQKKYLMQQLLTGRTRLKGFNTKWKKIHLVDILCEVDERTTSNNQYQIMSVTKNGIYSQQEYFDKQIASKNNIGYKILRKNNIVFSPMNLWMGSIGFFHKKIGIVSPAYKIFNINTKITIFDFLKYFMTTSKMLYLYKINSEVGASVVRRNLDMKGLLSSNIYIPSVKEQKAIAEVLSSADKEIDLLKQKLTKLEEQKKGLMQVLLIGKVRLK